MTYIIVAVVLFLTGLSASRSSSEGIKFGSLIQMASAILILLAGLAGQQ